MTCDLLGTWRLKLQICLWFATCVTPRLVPDFIIYLFSTKCQVLHRTAPSAPWLKKMLECFADYILPWSALSFFKCISLKQSVCAGRKEPKLSAGTVAVWRNFFSSHCERSPGSARPRQSCSKYANMLQSSPSVGAEGSPGGHFIRRASCRGDFFCLPKNTWAFYGHKMKLVMWL